jgi:glycosyltransferase involved in cell wall biosynthesis
MRVLYVANNYPPHIIGGAELIAHRHAKEIAALGIECCVFAGDHSGSGPPCSIRKDFFEGLTVFRVALSGAQTAWQRANFKNPEIDRLFADALIELKPHVVHFHNLPGLSVDLIDIARRAGCHTILTVHDHWGFCHRQTLTRLDGSICRDFSACRSCLPHFIDLDGTDQPIEARNEYVRQRLKGLDWLLSPSSYLADQYMAAAMAPANVGVLGYGVDLRLFSPKRTMSNTSSLVQFGVACYLGEHKGIRVILDAVARLPSDLPIKLTFAGKGPLKDNIIAFIEQHPNGRMISYAGDISPDSMSSFYHSMDVFISASVWPENQPLTIMESMASGLAVIATNCGGSPELVTHARTGFLVEPEREDELAHAMLAYAVNPETARRHGQAGTRCMAARGLQHTVRRLVTLYHELAQQIN